HTHRGVGRLLDVHIQLRLAEQVDLLEALPPFREILGGVPVTGAEGKLAENHLVADRAPSIDGYLRHPLAPARVYLQCDIDLTRVDLASDVSLGQGIATILQP